MDTLIRTVETDDLTAVLELNDSEVPHVSRIGMNEMQWFATHAHHFRVAENASKIVGFIIGLGPGTEYQSPNYQWFCKNYSSFKYVDRIVVGESARQEGLGSRFYDDFAETRPGDAKVMTCEVNVIPANDTSMQFHLRRGFRKVGSQVTDGGQKEVAFLEKVL
jgi:predicted GNAT superfamily acetyltransferase